MNLMELSSDDKVAYLIKPILKVLQEAGGQLERSEIKERITELDDQIAEYSEVERKSTKTGNIYKDFDFSFNFAIKDLSFNGLLTYMRSSPVTLTEKGLYLDVDKLDVQKEVMEPSKKVLGRTIAKTTRKIKQILLKMRKSHKQKKRSKMILRNLCLPL